MDYRTENENEVFKIFRRFTAVCEGEKEKATTDFARLSPSVGMRRLERPTPTNVVRYQLRYIPIAFEKWCHQESNLLLRLILTP